MKNIASLQGDNLRFLQRQHRNKKGGSFNQEVLNDLIIFENYLLT